jgi:hypothetical protein
LEIAVAFPMRTPEIDSLNSIPGVLSILSDEDESAPYLAIRA